MRIFSDAGGCYLDNQFDDVLRRWRQPGDQTDVPRASYDGVSGAAEISSRYIEDGSYWRLQDLTLGYRLPERWAGAPGLRLGAVLRLGAQPVHHHRLLRLQPGREQQRRVQQRDRHHRRWVRSPASAWAPTSTPTPWPAPFTFGVQAAW